MDTQTAATFKSHRSASIAVKRAERAYKAAEENARETRLSKPCDSDAREQADSAAAASFEQLRALYATAKAQGFFVYVYDLSANGTRDLILANID